MAKGFFKKAIIFTTIVGAAAAGGMALYNKYKASSEDFDDDFLDFDDDDSDESNEDGYVSFNKAKDEPVEVVKDNGVKVNVNIDTSDFKDEDFDNDEDDTNDEDDDKQEDDK